jgi:putative endonuclease
MKQPMFYIMASQKNGTLYTGVTSNLIKRVYEHRNNLIDGFTKKYGCKLLVFYEAYVDMYSAIEREKQIKARSRQVKLKLIESTNPQWKDLYNEII